MVLSRSIWIMLIVLLVMTTNCTLSVQTPESTSNIVSTSTLFPTPTETDTPTVSPSPITPMPLLVNHDKRALWVWNEEVVTDENAKAQFLQFVRSEHINTLYLHAYGLFTGNPTALESFIAEAGGIEVELLVGDPSLALATHHTEILNFVRDAVTFSQNANNAQRLVGLHFDIEPYLLEEWKSDQADVIVQYLDLLSSIREMLTEVESPLLLSADMPFWFDTIEATYNGETKALHQHIQDIVDCVVLMDYRDVAEGSDGIIAHAQDELIYGNQIGKLVTVGLETNCVEPAKITFCEEGKEVMAEEMEKAAAIFKAHPSFHGFAIHDYSGYLELSQQPTPTSTSVSTILPTATLSPSFTLSLPSSCPSADAEGTQPPSVAISSTAFVVNDVEQVVADFELLRASPGDEVKVKQVTICTEPFEGKGGIVYVEFDPVNQNGRVIASEVKSTGAIQVIPGIVIVPGSDISWVMNDNWRHLSVVTVHYPPGGSDDPTCEGGKCEKDDRVIINIE